MNLKSESVLRSRNLVLRDAKVDDSEFILKLRTDPVKAGHLSETAPSLSAQREWMKAYEARTDQAYFIIEDYQRNRLGCIRIYNPHDASFEWGSWLIVNGAAPFVALESALLIYSYARSLGFTTAKINVRQQNTSVWQFHEKIFNAKLVDQDGLDRFYEVDRETIDEKLNKHHRLLVPRLGTH